MRAKIRLLLFLPALLLPGLFRPGDAAARRLRVSYDFPAPVVRPAAGGGGDVRLDGCDPWVMPGRPVLPFRPARILLPEGYAVRAVSVRDGGFRALAETVRLVPAPAPASPGVAVAPVPPPPPAGRFPGRAWEEVGVHRARGHAVLLLNLFPVRHDPATGSLEYTRRLEVTVELAAWPGKPGRAPAAASAAGPPGPGRLPGDHAALAALVDNPADLPAPAAARRPAGEEGGDYRYVVITSRMLAESGVFDPLLEARRAAGLTARVVSVEEITADYTSPLYQDGADRPAQIRNFIGYAWRNWDTRYVLLGGDQHIIPPRYLPNPHPFGTGGPIPGDIYYSNLEGDFSVEIDLLSDVRVGRAPVSTIAQARNFVHKTLAYRGRGTDRLRQIALVGERLDERPNFGGDGKDDIAAAFLPADWEASRFYQRDGTHGAGLIAAQMNAGVQLVNNFSHGTGRYSFGFTAGGDVSNLRNDHYFIIYSQGCDEGAYDRPDRTAIGAFFVTAERGAAAFIGNARRGWYDEGDVLRGPSQLFDRRFFEVLFEENITGLGAAFHAHKDLMAGQLADGDWGLRYVMYGLNLFGDPALEVFPAPPVVPPAAVEGLVYHLADPVDPLDPAAGYREIRVHDLAAEETRPVVRPADDPRVAPGAVRGHSLSAAGRVILFDYAYDNPADPADPGTHVHLYRVNSDGSGLENLTEALGLDSLTVLPAGAALCPQGERLAFAAAGRDSVYAGRQLWLRELAPGGRLVQLTFLDGVVSHPLFLDRNRLIFHFADRGTTREDYYQVFTTGTGLRDLTGHRAGAPYFPRLGRPFHCPDRGEISFARQDEAADEHLPWMVRARGLYPGAASRPLLGELYYEGTADAEVAFDPAPVFAGGEDRLVFAGRLPGLPRGLYLAVAHDANPYLRRLPGTDNAAWPLFHRPPARYNRFAWAAPARAEGGDGRLYRRDHDGEAVAVGIADADYRDPVFSADGRQLAVAAAGIRVSAVDGSDQRLLDDTFGARHPAFSPCGRWLAYVRPPENGGEGMDIYARAVDGTGPAHRLTSAPAEIKADLGFRPLSGAAGDYDTDLLYTGGGRLRRLPVSFTAAGPAPAGAVETIAGAARQGAWCPAGETIYFVSTDSQPPALYRLAAAGGNRAPLAVVPAPAAPAWPRPAPDPGDRRLVFADGGDWHRLDLDSGAAVPLRPGFRSTTRADWAPLNPEALAVTRRFPFDRVGHDAAGEPLPLRYRLLLDIDAARAPEGPLLLREEIPHGWEFAQASLGGHDFRPSIQLDPAGGDRLAWSFDRATPGFTAGRGELAVTLQPAAVAPGQERGRFFAGVAESGAFSQPVRGEYALAPLNPADPALQPFLPVDLDRDWRIDDRELLYTIGLWVGGGRENGWPRDAGADSWDRWLLDIIGFWVAGTYTYDFAESGLAGEPRWR